MNSRSNSNPPSSPNPDKADAALSAEDLDKAAGGVTFNYGGIAITYVPQHSDAPITETSK